MFFGGIVEDLDLEAGGGLRIVLAMMVAVLGDSDIDTAVATDGQQIIEAHREVVVLTTSPQPRAFLAGADE